MSKQDPLYKLRCCFDRTLNECEIGGFESSQIRIYFNRLLDLMQDVRTEKVSLEAWTERAAWFTEARMAQAFEIFIRYRSEFPAEMGVQISAGLRKWMDSFEWAEDAHLVSEIFPILYRESNRRAEYARAANGHTKRLRRA